MSKREINLLIGDMLESATKIFVYTKGMTYEQFLIDSKTKDAVVRNFEIIGEAANRLPEEFRLSHTAIDWQRIRGLRNRIVHEYFGIDYSIVWTIKEEYLPKLISDLESLPLE
jgi:uncharacterized protein with HEPN domain